MLHFGLECGNIIDIICLKDFIFGIPNGGKYIINGGTVACAPYVYPFGNIQQWASIYPPHANVFSLKMLKIARDFWRIVDNENNIKSNLSLLETPPTIWPQTTDLIVEGLSIIINQRLYDNMRPLTIDSF